MGFQEVKESGVCGSFHYGQRVSVYHKGAIREGVVLDQEEGSGERVVLLLDSGCGVKTTIANLGPSTARDPVDWSFLSKLMMNRGGDHAPPTPNVAVPMDVDASPGGDSCVLDQDHPDPEKGPMVAARGGQKQWGVKAEDCWVVASPGVLDDRDHTEELPMVSGAVVYDDSGGGNRGGLKQNRGVDDVWVVAGPELVPGAKFCPGAIDEVVSLGAKRAPESLVTDARQHLLYLRWKIEVTPYKQNRTSYRYRYTWPDTGKSYLSLRALCRDLKNPGSGICSLVQVGKRMRVYEDLSPVQQAGDGSQNPNKRKKLRFLMETGGLVGEPQLTRVLRSNRQQLDHQITDTELNVACKELFAEPMVATCKMEPGEESREQSNVPHCEKVIEAGRRMRESENFFHVEQAADGSQNPRKGRKVRILMEMGGLAGGLPRVLRSNRQQLDHQITDTKLNVACKELFAEPMVATCKMEPQEESREQSTEPYCEKGMEVPDDEKESASKTKTPTPLKRNPRSVLSWLIDNNVVSEGDKVSYRVHKPRNQWTEGRITREGIDCDCCRTVFGLTAFEAHAGSTNHRPAANIFLEDGRSLMECTQQSTKFVKKNPGIRKMPAMRGRPNKKLMNKDKSGNDYICSLCQDGGDLLLCDKCPSSFHQSCLGLQDIPDGEWFCFSCCCCICGQLKFEQDIQRSPDARMLSCHQCQRNYHTGCLENRSPELEHADGQKGNWFCSIRCKDLYIGLQELRNPVVVAGGGLTWTLVKSSKPNGCDINRLHGALEVMHECFDPVKDGFTGKDVVENIIYGKGCKLRRMNCRGFYTVLLERGSHVITAATLRILGDKVAELPLIATRFEHQRMGMCRILMDHLEKQLVNLGVERLVLPAATSTVDTWVKGFGFTELSERNQHPGLVFLDFAGTIRCEKVLKTSNSTELTVNGSH